LSRNCDRHCALLILVTEVNPFQWEERHISMETCDDIVAEQEFRAAPELRRAAYIFLWGIVFCVIVSVLVFSWIDGSSFSASLMIAPLLSILFAVFGSWWVNRYRIRVNGIGIHRRILFRWRTWPWASFASGTARAGSSYGSFVFPELRWRLRRLTFEFLDEPSRVQIMEKCLRHYVAPPPPETPDRIDIRIGALIPRYLRHRRIRADRLGLEMTRGQRTTLFRWCEVRQLVLFRKSHQHDDFLELVIYLPDRVESLKFNTEQGVRMWSGPKAPIVSSFFARHVPTERITYCAIEGPALSTAELDHRIARFDRMSKETRSVNFWARIIVAVSAAAYIALEWPIHLADDFDRLILLFGGCLFLVYCFAHLILLPRKILQRIEKQRTDLERQRTLLAADVDVAEAGRP